jgi:sec-independent protein translocase protein TatB
MLGMNFSEVMVIVIVLIVVVGPERLPPMLRTAGKYYGQVKRMSDEFRRALMLEVDRDEAEQRAAQFKKRREEAKRIADEARALQKVVAATEPAQPDATPVTDAAPRKEEEAS